LREKRESRRNLEKSALRTRPGKKKGGRVVRRTGGRSPGERKFFVKRKREEKKKREPQNGKGKRSALYVIRKGDDTSPPGQKRDAGRGKGETRV